MLLQPSLSLRSRPDQAGCLESCLLNNRTVAGLLFTPRPVSAPLWGYLEAPDHFRVSPPLACAGIASSFSLPPPLHRPALLGFSCYVVCLLCSRNSCDYLVPRTLQTLDFQAEYRDHCYLYSPGLINFIASLRCVIDTPVIHIILHSLIMLPPLGVIN